jgi:uncharacterized protein (UPF0305 family)
MTLEEQLADQERIITNAMKENRSQTIVYRMMEVYEDLYAEIKHPTPQQENSYIQIYFKYLGYSQRN